MSSACLDASKCACSNESSHFSYAYFRTVPSAVDRVAASTPASADPTLFHHLASPTAACPPLRHTSRYSDARLSLSEQTVGTPHRRVP